MWRSDGKIRQAREGEEAITGFVIKRVTNVSIALPLGSNVESQ